MTSIKQYMLRHCKVYEVNISFGRFIKISLCSFCGGMMKWSEMHDLYLCHKILSIKSYQFKLGSTYSGNAWNSIANDLCDVEEISFTVSQKSVRDRYRLL